MLVSILQKSKFVLIGVLIGGIIGYLSKPARIIETEKIVKDENLIKELSSKIKSLSSQLIEKQTRKVIVEKPDGTKTTTIESNLKKSTNKTGLVTDKTNLKNSKTLKYGKKKEIINSEKLNYVGIIYSTEMKPEYYVQAGMKCLLFRCFVGGRYSQQEVRAEAGIEIRF